MTQLQFSEENREKLWKEMTGYGELLHQMAFKVRNQASILQNPILFTEEEFRKFWDEQNLLPEEPTILIKNWRETHHKIALARQYVAGD